MRVNRRQFFWGVMAMMGLSSVKADAAGALDAQLLAAALQGDAPVVHALLAQGANKEARDGSGATALLIATHNNHVAAAKELIEAGADVNAKDRMQDSPYLYAGARGHNEILKLTLAHGADLKSTNRYGGTALIPAAERGHVQTVRILIAAGVDVNHINNLHWTALMEAIVLSNGGPQHVEIVRQLVDAKADVHLADAQGVTPLQHARQRGYQQIEEILLRAGAQR
ncbi:Ankyrin repeats (3 copies) [compost metagenome]